MPPSLLFGSAGTTVTTPRLESLVRHGHLSLDEDVLASRAYLLSPADPAETPWCGARVLRSARAEAGEIDDAPLTSVSHATQALRTAMDRAVDRAVEGASCIAVLTGGGLDSSALLALAVKRAERTGGTAFGVALDFGGPGDDRPYLEAVERHLGCTILRVRPEDAASRLELARSGVDAAPFTWPGGPMEVEMMARARALGADRALMGVGADHLFDGDPRSLAQVARALRLRDAVRRAHALDGFARPRFPAAAWVARPLVAAALPVWVRRRRAHLRRPTAPRWAGPTLLRVLARAHEADIERGLVRCASPRERYDAFLSSPHLAHLAWLRHQEEVASGLERRDPFLDPEVIATTMRIAPELLLAGDIRRGLFRRAVADLLPDMVLARKDKAEFEPAFARFARAFGGLEVLRPLATMTELAGLGIVEPEAFREAFDAFVAQPEDAEGWSTIWPTLAVESFVRAVVAARGGGA